MLTCEPDFLPWLTIPPSAPEAEDCSGGFGGLQAHPGAREAAPQYLQYLQVCPVSPSIAQYCPVFRVWPVIGPLRVPSPMLSWHGGGGAEEGRGVYGFVGMRKYGPWGLQYRPVSPSICAEGELTGPREPSCTSQQVFALMRALQARAGI